GGAGQPLPRQPHRLHRATCPADGGGQRFGARRRFRPGASQLQAGRRRADAPAARGKAARRAEEDGRAGAGALRQPEPAALAQRRRAPCRALTVELAENAQEVLAISYLVADREVLSLRHNAETVQRQLILLVIFSTAVVLTISLALTRYISRPIAELDA